MSKKTNKMQQKMNMPRLLNNQAIKATGIVKKVPLYDAG
jgi:hypothetical protein